MSITNSVAVNYNVNVSLILISIFRISSMGVQIPSSWQGVPAQAQLPAAQQLAQGVGSALPTATGVVAYPMQQFQVSPQVQNALPLASE